MIGKNSPADKAGNQSFARKSVNDGPGGFRPAFYFSSTEIMQCIL
nr:hypothetical protein [uncultured Shinella sp.]